VWVHLGVTLAEAALSFGMGVALGVPVGFLLARVGWLSALLGPYLRVLNALPRVVLAPIFLLWFGLGIWSKVALGVTVVFFIVFFNTYQGVREVEPVLLSNARMLGANERQLIRHVIVPSALVWIFSSLHISIGFAIIAVVVGEYLGSSKGIGYLISQAEGVFDTTGVFAGMAILAAVVLLVGAGVSRLERWLLRWKPERGAQSKEVM
ncbi:MAG: ABC transporter permease, partial [Bryobacteraceae bacterium]